jgi:hypothetical protein
LEAAEEVVEAEVDITMVLAQIMAEEMEAAVAERLR